MSKETCRRAGAVVCAALGIVVMGLGCWSAGDEAAPQETAQPLFLEAPASNDPAAELVAHGDQGGTERFEVAVPVAAPEPAPAEETEESGALMADSFGVPADGEGRSSHRPAPPPRVQRMRPSSGGPGRGGGRFAIGGQGLGGGGVPAAPRQLPQNGVLASTFVGGAGVEARLSDLLERGVMIDGQQVRIEAFQDRARLPYAVPSEEAVALHTELERTKVSARGDTVHLQIALLAKQGEAPPRPRLDLRLVIDRSGSMQDEGKWQNAIAAAHALVDRLERGDTFGLISYAENASLDFAPGTVGNGRAIHRAIDALRPGGGTNIGDALELARQNPPARRGPSDVAMVILLSDGMATVGVTDPRSLADTARKMFDDGGVLVTSIGVGTSFDEETMLGIAREGSGSYHFVRRAADISEILRDELEQRIQAVAQALRVRVVLGGGVVARRVYGSRLLSEEEHAAVRATEVATDTRIARELGITSDRARENEEGLRIHLPTFRRGDQHVILMELEVPGGRAGSMAGVARVYLDYKDLGRRENESAQELVLAERVADADEAMTSVERTVKRTVLSFQAGEALQAAANALSAEDAAEAARVLAERRELLEAAARLWRDPSLRSDATLLARYETVVGRAWNGFGSDDRRTLVMAMNYFGDRRMR